MKSITISAVQLKIQLFRAIPTAPQVQMDRKERGRSRPPNNLTRVAHCGPAGSGSAYVSACSYGKRHRLVMNMSPDRKDKTAVHIVPICIQFCINAGPMASHFSEGRFSGSGAKIEKAKPVVRWGRKATGLVF